MSDESKLKEHERLKLETSLGQKAVVHREDVAEFDDDQKQANAIIRAIGAGGNPNPEALQYHGSMVVHLYTPHTLGGMQFVSQILLDPACPEWLASEGVSAIRKDAMSAFGRKRQTRRSGY